MRSHSSTSAYIFKKKKKLKAGTQKRYLYTHAHSSIMHNNLVQPKHLSTDEWINKIVYIQGSIIQP